MKRALAVANASALANMAMTMYPDTINSLTDYECTINLSIRINKETMDKDEVYETFAACIVTGAEIRHYHHNGLDSDYIEIQWDVD